MKLNEIFSCQYETEISELTTDSRRKTRNGLYFCLCGTLDGHDFAEEAISNGTVALVCEKKLALDVPQIIVADSRIAMTEAAATFFGHPEKKLKLIGITGTNGKTTTSYIVKSILECNNKNVALIGTNGIFYKDMSIDPSLTTPDPIELFSIFAKLATCGAEYVVMEVSAHAAFLKKVYGLTFEVAAFTNLTQDHLDFFSDMENYYEAKKSFLEGKNRHVLINSDDAYGLRLMRELNSSCISYGYENPSDIFGIDLSMSEHGLLYVLNLFDEIINVKFSLPGRFNMYNTMCAAAICYILGVSSKTIEAGIRHVKKVDGRFNIINTTSGCIIIDFAHTDDGLKNILSAIKEFSCGKIITVFGCGGNRDKSKRAKMGKAASDGSDYVVITSDNPRFEKPMDIILEAEKGVSCPHCLIEDRKEAIKYAVKMAQKDDIVLIAGKGAEKYQDIGGVKIPYSDEEYVMQVVAEEGI